jgi:hypothetical protein
MAATDLRLDNVYVLALEPRKSVPLLRGWNRLECRPRIPDFERSLKAEVRDPLWFLTRQWQFGEFQGEDAASPIDIALGVRSAPLATLRIGSTDVPYDPSAPLETRVEREAVPFDMTLIMQGSRVFTRSLGGVFAKLLPKVIVHFPLKSIPGEPTEDAARLRIAGSAFLLDIAALLDSVRTGTFDTVVATITTIASEVAALEKAADDLVNWHGRIYGLPRTEPSAWQTNRLSYQFECQTAAGPDAVSLIANEYGGDALDWHSFDVGTPSPSPGSAFDAATLSFLPAGIEFAGMPSIRYWEMENGRTEFGHIDANTNDAAKLLLAEFMLLFSNDWCVVPLELNIGDFARVDGLLVTDVFGDQTWVRAANRGAGADWHHWSMYLLTGDDSESPGFFLAPALTSTIEAPPLEEVDFIRDEIANMVWAIEKRVASDIGEGVLLAVENPIDASSLATQTRYLLGTSVPAYWRPFLPVHLPGSLRSIRLQRARMPGPIEEPKAEILRVASPYFIEEEEVPRAGRLVKRAFQRSRWQNGLPFLWIGRHSEIGRGEGSSGLVFDHILEQGEHNIE